nr:MAG TPA: hypothetical protein [Caudoviricetes sp.]
MVHRFRCIGRYILKSSETLGFSSRTRWWWLRY